MKIRIGTRRSKLALWQAYFVQGELEKTGLETEIVEIDTKGDIILDVTIAKIGSKGVFTEEIEEKLRLGEIDIAVHSAKDMQSELPEGFEILAFTAREEVNDVLVAFDKSLRLTKDASLTIGTSSTRRVAMLRHYFPNIKTVDMRGNLQTRIKKLEDGHCDALILAYAGVHRMQYDDMIVEKLPTDLFTPPVGQGSIAIEVATHLDHAKKQAVKQLIDNPAAHACLAAERAYLKTLQGGCSIPSFAMASLQENQLTLAGGLVSLDGQRMIRYQVVGNMTDAEKLGANLGAYVLAHGGRNILEEIRKQQG